MRRLCLFFVLLLGMVGCTLPEDAPEVPELELLAEDQGWVQVRITGVSSVGYELHWGDVDSSYGTSNVVPGEELYEHFYQAVEGSQSGEQIPTEYEITLVDDEGHVVAWELILVESVDCHLSLVSVEGRQITVRYWGRFGIQYSVSWGDGRADHVIVSTQSASGLLTHTYDEAGTYTLGMEEIWAPSQPFFAVTVE